MAKRGPSPDAILNRLSVLRQAPSSPEFSAELRKALAHPSAALATRAAELACRYNRNDLTDELIAAYHRFDRAVAGAGAAKADEDKQCVARTALARALVELGATSAAAEGVYLIGARTVGGRVPPSNPDDFGADLRATCAHGLVVARHPEAAVVCADLLADAAPTARAGAARALAASGSAAAALLLRFRIRVGDGSPEVLAECATELMNLDAAQGLSAVADLLLHPDASVRAAAALAVGTPRSPAGLDPIRRAFAREAEPEVRQAMLVAAAATRSAEAVDWLVGLVSGTAVLATAAAAVEALGPYRLDQAVKDRVGGAVARRAAPALDETFRRSFGTGS